MTSVRDKLSLPIGIPKPRVDLWTLSSANVHCDLVLFPVVGYHIVISNLGKSVKDVIFKTLLIRDSRAVSLDTVQVQWQGITPEPLFKGTPLEVLVGDWVPPVLDASRRGDKPDVVKAAGNVVHEHGYSLNVPLLVKVSRGGHEANWCSCVSIVALLEVVLQHVKQLLCIVVAWDAEKEEVFS